MINLSLHTYNPSLGVKLNLSILKMNSCGWFTNLSHCGVVTRRGLLRNHLINELCLLAFFDWIVREILSNRGILNKSKLVPEVHIQTSPGDKGFVNNFLIHYASFCTIYWYWISRCFSLSSWSSSTTNEENPPSSLWSHTTSWLSNPMTIYLTTIIWSVKDVYFMFIVIMEPRLKQYLNELFMSLTLSSEFESTIILHYLRRIKKWLFLNQLYHAGTPTLLLGLSPYLLTFHLD